MSNCDALPTPSQYNGLYSLGTAYIILAALYESANKAAPTNDSLVFIAAENGYNESFNSKSSGTKS